MSAYRFFSTLFVFILIQLVVAKKKTRKKIPGHNPFEVYRPELTFTNSSDMFPEQPFVFDEPPYAPFAEHHYDHLPDRKKFIKMTGQLYDKLITNRNPLNPQPMNADKPWFILFLHSENLESIKAYVEFQKVAEYLGGKVRFAYVDMLDKDNGNLFQTFQAFEVPTAYFINNGTVYLNRDWYFAGNLFEWLREDLQIYQKSNVQFKQPAQLYTIQVLLYSIPYEWLFKLYQKRLRTRAIRIWKIIDPKRPLNGTDVAQWMYYLVVAFIFFDIVFIYCFCCRKKQNKEQQKKKED